MCTYSLADEIQKLANDLAESGHRDIKIFQTKNTLKVYYWPIGFRDDYRGFLDIKKRTLNYLPHLRNTEIEYIEFIQTSWGIPTVTAKLQIKNLSEKVGFTRKYYTEENNISSGYYPSKKFMILFDIPLSINFGRYYDPLIFKTGISPQFMYRFSEKNITYCQVDIYFHNEFDAHEYYKPGNIGIMMARTLKDNIISFTNIGAFREDLYGIDQELSVSLMNDKISFEFHGGLYGDQIFQKNEFNYKKISHMHALLKMIYSNATYDCRIKLLGGRFLYGDKGFGAEVSRIFKEVEIGFTGIKTGGDLVLNFFFSVPMFPKSRMAMAKHGISPVKHFRLKYWYYLNKLGREPQINTSLDTLNSLSNPAHYEFMSRNF